MPAATYGGHLFQYEEKGTGVPLILLHGVGLDHTMWDEQIDGLSQHYRVIAYDMPGHGGSEHPPAPHTLPQYAEHLAALMNYLDIDRAHIVGFSMGGMVAQSFAVSYPAKVDTLTIMSAVADRPEEKREAVLSRVAEVKEIGPAQTIEPAIQRWFNQTFVEKNQEVVGRIRCRLQRNDPESYLAAYTLFATADQELWPMLSGISQSALIMTGEHDMGSTPEMAGAMGRKIRQSTLAIIPGVKHMLPIEAAEVVNERIHRFIMEHECKEAKECHN
ncbi:3-oxoadipate enol-lactonase [Scopulibacillus darangshiensis]|uniref:3-oxoadipate enol-lactonase n=1 Tax=Scopulibacillus darangshiensis TaxID=442528 RepID=A0A4R2NU12_9BACL|nr:alpha/beta fold hydrolase [Scopulibacillus darangshiensis]TCP24958.1 3-oxoadipate enol-lactonase [Scopulibacillus darangshiensis]